MRIGNQNVDPFVLNTLSSDTVGIPEETRRRLRVREGQPITIGNRRYTIVKVPLNVIRSFERRGVSQDNMMFFQTIPVESRSATAATSAATNVVENRIGRPSEVPRPSAPSVRAATPTPPAPPGVSPPTPISVPVAAVPAPIREEESAVVIEPEVVLPKTRVNGREMVLCVGHNMPATDATGNFVRLPAAARTALSVNRDDSLTINSRVFVVHESYRTDLAQYSQYSSLVGESEMIFIHPQSILESDNVFDVERVAMHLPIVDEAEAVRMVRARIEEVVGADISQDIAVECEVRDGLTSVKLKYLPGVEAITEAPANLDAAVSSVARVMEAQLDRLIASMTNFKQRLQRI